MPQNGNDNHKMSFMDVDALSSPNDKTMKKKVLQKMVGCENYFSKNIFKK